ncbi:endonuclease III domain-containing protein [Phosphitispora sp. TUW77]|uniref:endonuclease III domain-containing protein n=1 Tax=Phosphitispora sp. TUW77 TaxID=3152361 RepID=UPI003AB76C30
MSVPREDGLNSNRNEGADNLNPAENSDYELMHIFNIMLEYFGPRGWWPGETIFEVCVGAILTQSVSWKNVMKAIGNLKKAGLLEFDDMYMASDEVIEQCIIPAMYYRMKTKKLKAFLRHVAEKHNGHLVKMFTRDRDSLRKELLGIYGIGPETADSIILYAAQKPIFVVDTYTKRIFSRLGIFKEEVTYDQMQDYFMKRLYPDVPLYNEYHALLTGIGNRFCSIKKPKCIECPLNEKCNYLV